MLNNTQIDPLNLIEENSYTSDLSKYTGIKDFISNFDDILKMQLISIKNNEFQIGLPEENKYQHNPIIDDAYQDTEGLNENYFNRAEQKKPEKNNIEDEKQSISDKIDNKKDLKEKEATDKDISDKESLSNTNDINIESKDRIDTHSIDEEETSGESIRKTLLEMLSNIQTLLNLLLSKSEKNNDIHDISISLKKLLEGIINDKGNRKDKKLQIETILSRIKSLLKKIEHGKSTFLKNSDFYDKILALKNELQNLSKILKKYAGKSEQAADLVHKSAIESSDINSKTNNKILFNNDLSNSKSEGNPSSDSNNSNIGFHFKNNSSAYRNTSSTVNLQNRNAFNEQLQSIIQNARIFIRDSRNGSFSIRLHPASLGRVNINLGLEQGVLHGRFLVDNMDSKNLLLENISLIKEQLEEAGISVGEFQVNVRDNGERLADQTEGNKLYFNQSNSASPVDEYDIISTYLHDGTIDMII